MHICNQKKFNRQQFDRLCELIEDEAVDINCTMNSKTPLLFLCYRKEHCEILYPVLKMLLKRDDLLINATNDSGLNALMYLCKCYPVGDDLLECATLVIERGIDTRAKELRSGQNALNILFDRDRNCSIRLAQIIKSMR